jgi:HEAT repeat protein
MQLLLRDSASDVRRSASKALKRFGKVCPGFGGRMVEFVPVLVTLVKDPNTHVKLAAERALMHSLQVLSDEALLRVR